MENLGFFSLFQTEIAHSQMTDISNSPVVIIGDSLETTKKFISQDVIIKNCYFYNNMARLNAGSVDLMNSNCTIVNAAFEQNKARDGACITALLSSLKIKRSNLTYNAALSNGGSIMAIQSILRIKDVQFGENEAESMGGCVYMVDTLCTITKGCFVSNSAQCGDVLYIQSSNLSLEGSFFLFNQRGKETDWASVTLVNNKYEVPVHCEIKKCGFSNYTNPDGSSRPHILFTRSIKMVVSQCQFDTSPYVSIGGPNSDEFWSTNQFKQAISHPYKHFCEHILVENARYVIDTKKQYSKMFVIVVLASMIVGVMGLSIFISCTFRVKRLIVKDELQHCVRLPSHAGNPETSVVGV